MHQELAHIMNVYCPCDLDGKRKFWEEAKATKLGLSSNLWCVVGDFNSILQQEERKGIGLHHNRREGEEFNQFVLDMELFYLPLSGKKFTWFLSNGNAMSRIDRFLVNDGWLVSWGNLVQLGLPKTFSDHCPILLKIDNSDWGPTPFHTNNCWFSDHRFNQFVVEEWKKLEINGRGSFVFKEKLKKLKVALKRWNKHHFGMLDRKIEDQVEVINYVDAKGSSSIILDEDINLSREATTELWRLSRQNDNLLLQKSRQRWIRDGDSNSKFFHLSINKNQKFKKFTGLSIEGEWIEDPTRVKNYISSSFEAKFEECTGCRPSLDGIGFNHLAAEENAFLTAKFEVEEIKGAIWSCDGDKSPSPDGFNFSFLKKFWECLKDDFIRMVEDFYSFGNLPRGCNASFIVLIPKNNSP
ncbi:PREDICTED: uncharacterized protein LOC109340346 [Lupinus angustifolius]|uniref:uncharacterized protein LOC109340346 n=1 Tax=Lupinus angustifolius TaxID=3871 RepID=UPI00092EFF26|nr:PREDICTED: uncharacterized protein LOC109340346 [Lupinus angustifolius]